MSWARENVPGIPGACATRNFTYLVKGPWSTSDPFQRDYQLINELLWKLFFILMIQVGKKTMASAKPGLVVIFHLRSRYLIVIEIRHVIQIHFYLSTLQGQHHDIWCCGHQSINGNNSLPGLSQLDKKEILTWSNWICLFFVVFPHIMKHQSDWLGQLVWKYNTFPIIIDSIPFHHIVSYRNISYNKKE